jgi:hypothetical protein
MHPTLKHEIARYRQVDMLREAAHARLAREARPDGDKSRRRLTWRRRRRQAFKPALS